MTKKYYTPTIEEFHVGFECELRNSSGNNFEWEFFKIIGVDDGEISGLQMDWSFYDTQNAIKEKMIRVKYLDSEDIESLGWIKRLVDWEIESDNQILRLSYYNQEKTQMCIEDKNTKTPYFIGYIKNKSELKKVMQMIGII